MRSILIAVLLVGCAGRVNAPKVWIENPKPADLLPGDREWDYGIQGALEIGRVTYSMPHAIVPQKWSYWAYGCNTSAGPFDTLQQAESYVETSCAKVNQ
jgi:hypothetical protein